MNKTNDKRHLFNIFLLSLPIIIVFFLNAFTPLIPTDDARYPYIALEMLHRGDFIIPTLNYSPFLDKPILYYWVTIIGYKLFGITTLTARVFPFFCSILMSSAGYYMSAKIWGKEKALIAGLVFQANIVTILLLGTSNMDLGIAVFITLTILAVIVAIGHSKNKYYVWAYIFAALGLLTKGLIAIAIPIAIISIWIVLYKKWKLIPKFFNPWGLLLFLLIALPWFIIAELKLPLFWYYFFYIQHYIRYINSSHFNGSSPFYSYILITTLGVIIWIVPFVMSFVKKSVRTNKYYIFICIWGLFILIFLSIPSAKPLGYIEPIFYPISLLISFYITQLNKKKHTSLTLYSYILILVVMSALLIISQAISLLLIAIPIITLVAILSLKSKNNLKQVLLLSYLLIIILPLGKLIFLSNNSKNNLFTYRKYTLGKQAAEALNYVIKPGQKLIFFNDYLISLNFYLKQEEGVYVGVDRWDDIVGEDVLIANTAWQQEYLHKLTKYQINYQQMASLLKNNQTYVVVRRQDIGLFNDIFWLYYGIPYDYLFTNKDFYIVYPHDNY